MWDKITKVTFSGVTTVNVDGCFTTAYQHYLITRDITGTVSRNWINVRLRASGTNAATNYAYAEIYASTTYSSQASTTQTYIDHGLGFTHVGAFGFGQLYISAPAVAAYTSASAIGQESADATPVGYHSRYTHLTASAYDGFSIILTQGGTIQLGNISGSVTVYGLKES